MNIVFAGTPDYAVPSLKALAQSSHALVGVLSQPNRPKGRSGTPTPPPVVAAALELHIPHERILQPETVNAPEALEWLKTLQPDVLCVVAYGGLLRKQALAIPRLCALNAHGSLLPKYRGATPIQAALLNGEDQTGVTMIKMVRALDAGPILLKLPLPIGHEENAASLHDKLAALSADGFLKALEMLQSGNAIFEPQDETQATYVGKLEKDSGRIDWSRPAQAIVWMVQAMTPWPGAWTVLQLPERNLRLRLEKVALSQRTTPPHTPGNLRRTENLLKVCCGDGQWLEIMELQPEGKKAMTVESFLCGLGRSIDQANLL